MSMASLVCWLAFFLVVMYINPNSAGFFAVGFFYVSLFLSIVGTFAVLGFVLRRRFLQGELIFRQVAVTFRQAFWFGLFAVVSLWMQHTKFLTWYNLLLLIMGLAILEFFFLSTNRSRKN
jgi:hypothetical protein